ncbi:MAG: tRNA pseudouridine synthase [Fibrobacteres bacterium]|nr:tRNA pseudouridine synthase [Fibrobacterota bacterium]
MGRYRFAVEYLGTPYAGWQIQPAQATVQSELEKALEVCLRVPVLVVGAGRTDAGVHASGQVAHFECEADLDPRRIQRSVNALTGDSIFIRRLEACPPDFHARYSALSRLYRYRIALRPTALLGGISWYPGMPLDADAFRRALADVEGTHDFVNFCVPREDGKSTLCEVLRADAVADEAFLTVTLEANRFLHKMVRSIVGACFDVARGALPGTLVRDILAGTYRGERTWAPALGLCLERVGYRDYEY